MDRPLPTSLVRRYHARQVFQVALPVIALAAIVALLPGWMRPTLTRARLRTAVVQSGPIEAVITAAGTVVPEIERSLSSPVDARLLRLLKRPGDPVRPGEPVAELDLADARLALDKIASDLAIAENKQSQAQLALERALSDLDARIERQLLDAEILDQKAATAQRLFDEGLTSQQQLADARLAAKQAAIQLAQLRRERVDAQRSTDLQAEGLSLERDALSHEAGAARRTLDLATTHADRDGVLTWIVTQEGTLVRRGEVIARIADLRTFRIAATASDVHSGRIRSGMPVNVLVNDTALRGAVASVEPNVDNDTIRFTVALEERSHAALRPNMRVDVLVVTDYRPKALKVRQGSFVTGADRSDVYVLRDRRVRRVSVQFGARSFDEVEVRAGLTAGDEVILSDMTDYKHLTEMEVR
jgi:HlyD family secretion protein